MLAALRSRFRRSTLGVARVEVCPPSLLPALTLRKRVARWLRAPAPMTPPANPTSLPPVTPAVQAARDDFAAGLADVPAEAAAALAARIGRARSLRELWHLRAAVFHLVAVHHSQFEANRRLLTLARHFPTRSPRSGFTPFES